jgi:hypothetical protein
LAWLLPVLPELYLDQQPLVLPLPRQPLLHRLVVLTQLLLPELCWLLMQDLTLEE